VILALGLGWRDLVEQYSFELPTVDELDSSEIGGRVVDVLREGSDPIEAVDYAYDLYRRFPDEVAAHRALIVAFLAPTRGNIDIAKPERVSSGTAVWYLEVGGEERHCVVIEDSPAPSLTRKEYPPSHPLARAMLGRVIGEEFMLSESSLREPRGVILDILDKRVFRMNELLLNWRERFPDEPLVEAIPVKSNDPPSIEDFSEMVKVMRRITEHQETVEEFYVEGRLPIATMAKFNGRSVFETMSYLAAKVDLVVRVCKGTAQEAEGALQSLNEAAVVVLEPSAAATLALLEETDLLRLLPFQLLVTEGTLDELRNLIRDDYDDRASGYMGYKDGRLWITDFSPEQANRRRQRLAAVLAELEKYCDVIGGSDVAKVDAILRRKLGECLAIGSLEAVAAASARGAVLWTEDFLLVEMLKEAMPAARVWTQAVLRWANEKGQLARGRRSRGTAKMLRHRYSFTSSNEFVVLDTCEAALWRPEDPDLAAVLADFGNPAWDHESALGMTMQTLGLVWRQAPTVEHARAITAMLLTHLADREDHRKILRILVEEANSLLGLAVTRVAPFRDVVEVFVRRGVTLL
jgi:hypothetical protein